MQAGPNTPSGISTSSSSPSTRLELTHPIEDQIDGKFVALNLVEGESCEILSPTGEAVELRFAESMIIPAGRYIVRNIGARACKVVKAFVK